MSCWLWLRVRLYIIVMLQQQRRREGRVPIFLPLSKITVFWQLFVILYILWDFVLTVATECFERHHEPHLLLYDYFDRLTVPILLFDVLISFNTSIVDNGKVTFTRKGIAIKYIASLSFWVDIVAFVVSVVQVIANERSNYQTAYNFIVFVKIIKIYSFDKNIKRYALKTSSSLLIYQIGKNLILLSVICYTLGAFFYLIDYDLLSNNVYPIGGTNNPNPKPYWIIFSASYPNIIDQNLWVKVTYCFYFTIVLLSGVAYGDLVPLNPMETLYVTLLLFFPLVVYSYIFNAVYNIISQKRERNKLIRKYQFITTRYLKNLKVKKTLETKLITYLSFIFKKTAHDMQFVEFMAPSVRREYLTHNIRAKFDFLVFEQLLEVAPRTNRDRFEDSLIEMIKEEAFPERYKLILPPDRFKLYYINQGICKRVAVKFPGELKYSDAFTRGQYFGYFPFLAGVYNYKLTYESSNFVVVQSIDRLHFLELLKRPHFFELQEAFFMMREEKLMYANQTIDGELCFFCNSSAHMFDRCHHLRPEINYSQAKQRSLSKDSFARKGAQRVADFKRRKIQSTRVILEECPVLVKEELPEFMSVQVQCSVESLEGMMEESRWHTGKVAFYSVYYPEHNFKPGFIGRQRQAPQPSIMELRLQI